MMHIISFSNHKGGTGKTTSVVNIACALRDKNKKVLIIDLDPQGNLSYSFGINDFKYDVIDWITNKANDNDCIIQTSGIYLVPASVEITDKEDIIKTQSNYKNILKHKINNLDFDFVLIDCAPTIGVYTQIALTASNFVIVPILLEILSIQGLSQIMRFIYEIKKTSNPNIEIIGVLGVCVNESRKLSNEVLEYIDMTYKVDVFNNRVHNNVKAAEAPSFGKSVIDYAPKSISARDYIAVTDELLRKISILIDYKLQSTNN